MIQRPQSLEKLLALLRSLPSVGPKMSERIAFHILSAPEQEIKNMLEIIQETYAQVRPCEQCGYWDDHAPCRICSDSARDASVICVVENSQDLIAFSRVKDYVGMYHVLGGALSPLDGVGPQDLRVELLIQRLESGAIKEVILGLNADLEGETTAQYLAKQIQTISDQMARQDAGRSGIRITRLAQGLPAGAELEYMDEVTLLKALDNRKVLS